MSKIIHKLNWAPQPVRCQPEFTLKASKPIDFPVEDIDFLQWETKGLPLDQGQEGSCVPNSFTGNLKSHMNRTGYPEEHMPSRNYGYYNCRMEYGDVTQDEGCNIGDYVAAFNKHGMCPEDSNIKWSWPYESDLGGKYSFDVKPNPECYKDAIKHQVKTYAVPNDPEHIMAVITQMKANVTFGIPVWQQFESDQAAANGIIKMPPFWQEGIGGHCMRIGGYHRLHQVWYVMNSYGGQWGATINGKRGIAVIPWKYTNQFADDLTAIESYS